MPAKTIDNILTELENIITEAIQTNNRMGYFAALYYKVTASVKEGIANGRFENGPQWNYLMCCLPAATLTH